VETDDLVAKDVGTRSQRARDLHVPGEAVLCMVISIHSVQHGASVTH
jgi:hypothetical protein